MAEQQIWEALRIEEEDESTFHLVNGMAKVGPYDIPEALDPEQVGLFVQSYGGYPLHMLKGIKRPGLWALSAARMRLDFALINVY